jgi:hypothetical protein
VNSFQKAYRFVWRSCLNAVCTTSLGRTWLYPPERLSLQFGPADGEYAWRVFLGHVSRLEQHGFGNVHRALEVGPGQNLGTALLWWSYLNIRATRPVEVLCWDIFRNAEPEGAGFWASLANELLDCNQPEVTTLSSGTLQAVRATVASVARGGGTSISYRVVELDELIRTADTFDLVYSQAAIEHIWFIESFWEGMSALTRKGGWHSHRIDLADHGRRQTNCVEMLQWSDWAYWATQRFIPGAVNRWRAGDHIRKLEQLGFRILQEDRDMRKALPVPRSHLSRGFRGRSDSDLLTCGLHLTAIRES